MEVRGRHFSLRSFGYDRTIGTVLAEDGSLVAGWSIDSATGAVHVLGTHAGSWRGAGIEETVLAALEDLLDQSECMRDENDDGSENGKGYDPIGGGGGYGRSDLPAGLRGEED